MFVITQGFLGRNAITQGYGGTGLPVDQGGGGAYPDRRREPIARRRQPVNTDADDVAAIMLACEVLGVFD